MPIVITPEDFILYKQSLKFEGFFVDTQIIIYNQDPFGKSTLSQNLKTKYEEVQTTIHKLKSSSLKAYSSLPVLFEYYKHIQINSYMLFLTKNKFDDQDFKYQKKNNSGFTSQWESQMKLFKRIFLRSFPVFDYNINGDILINNFNFMNMDFGDHFLSHIVSKVDKKVKAIFSNDSDFYSLQDDIFLITTNSLVISQAKQEKKYFQPI